MTEGLVWGFPIVVHLFLVALGAGTLTVSASVLLRGGGGGFGGEHFALARYGALIAPIPVIADGLILVAHLESFQAGHWFRWLNLYKVVNLAPMNVGTWLISLFIVVSLVYAYTFVRRTAAPGDALDRLRRVTAWIAVPLGIAVGVYTGVLLGAMPARPFWNSPILSLLFLLSALSMGIAAIMLVRAAFHRATSDADAEHHFQESGYLLASSNTLLIGLQVLAVILYVVFAHLAVGDMRYAVSVILFGGSLAGVFWLLFVLIGLLLPGLADLIYVVPKLLYHREYAPPRPIIIVSIAVLVGAFALRYVVVVAGQISGPVGI